MNKKGFSLVELLITISLLGLLSLIVIPTVLNVIKSSKEALYKTQINNIKSAAKTYMLDLDLEENSTIVVTLGDLKKSGYLDKELSNPKTGEEFNDCIPVEVFRQGKLYKYYVDDLSDNNCNSNLDYRFILLGSLNETVVKGSSYSEKGVIIQNKNGQKLDNDTVKVDIKRMKNNTIVQSLTDINLSDVNNWIDFNDYYNYEITYKYKIDEIKEISIKRNVIVADQTSLNCEIVLDGNTLENGWTTGNRMAHIVLLNTPSNGIKYSLFNVDANNFSDNYSLTLENDGIYELYGYIKDSDGKQIACINNGMTARFELGNPSCHISFSGNKKNGWYAGHAVAKLNVNEISPVEDKDITLINSVSYDGNSKMTLTESGTVYGFIKDAVGKEKTCLASVQVDPTTDIDISISGSANGSNYVQATTVNTNVLMTASILPATTLSGYSYQWYKDDNVIDGAISTSYTASSSGNYKLLVTTGSGVSILSDGYIVIINK